MSVQMFLVRAVGARQVALSTAISLLLMHFLIHVNSPSKPSTFDQVPVKSVLVLFHSISFHIKSNNSLENENTINNFISLIYGTDFWLILFQ